jgi:hypothetical protein
LLRECCKTIGQGEEDIADYVDMIEEKNKAEVEQAFYKEPEPITYNPDKSVEEQLRDFIADYRRLPEDSVEKILQHAIIVAHV